MATNDEEWIDDIFIRLLEPNNGFYAMHAKAAILAKKREWEEAAELDALGRLIPNFDGVGTIGYEYDDGAWVAVDVRINQLAREETS